ncbi:MAG TPA: lipopolysaccharide heptosyltransferase II [Casimicrobiaceae bacterium]|nr:lipopolysaccharide heptosyltransferase II [Casimicrobiaceae bacterium]
MITMDPSWRSARSLLAVRLDGIGDLLMTTPALRALKQDRRGRSLTLLTSPAGAIAARELPFVDDVIVFTAPWMKAAEAVPVSPVATASLVEQLRERAFDAAIVFTVFTQSALPSATLLHLAGIPRRAAYSRENPYALLTDWRADPDRDAHAGVRHEVQRQIDLVQSLGTRVRDTRLSFPVREDARRSMLACVVAAGMEPGRPWLIVHPGATAASRRYPHDKLADAIGRLQQRGRWQIAVAGTAEDRECARRIAASVNGVVPLTGVLDLAELAALLQAAELVVCNNSAPAHIAAAVGTPVVDLYALTNPQHTPWGVAHRVLSHDVDCKYCLKSACPQRHHRCLADVAPGEIVAAVDALLPDAPVRVPPRVRAFAGAGAGAGA